MKRTTTKTEITVETRQRITLRGRGGHAVWDRAIWCDKCSATVGMCLPERAAIICRTTAREIYRQVESGELHFVETRDGVLFICGNSFPHN